jgi:hypothetical protein
MTDKSFAPWAPAEGTVEAQNYLRNLLEACGQDPSLGASRDATESTNVAVN